MVITPQSTGHPTASYLERWASRFWEALYFYADVAILRIRGFLSLIRVPPIISYCEKSR